MSERDYPRTWSLSSLELVVVVVVVVVVVLRHYFVVVVVVVVLRHYFVVVVVAVVYPSPAGNGGYVERTRGLITCTCTCM